MSARSWWCHAHDLPKAWRGCGASTAPEPAGSGQDDQDTWTQGTGSIPAGSGQDDQDTWTEGHEHRLHPPQSRARPGLVTGAHAYAPSHQLPHSTISPAPKCSWKSEAQCGAHRPHYPVDCLLSGLKRIRKLYIKTPDFHFLLKRSKDLAMVPHASRVGRVPAGRLPAACTSPLSGTGGC